MRMCLVDSQHNVLSNNIKRKKRNFAVESDMRTADAYNDVVGHLFMQKSWKRVENYKLLRVRLMEKKLTIINWLKLS